MIYILLFLIISIFLYVYNLTELKNILVYLTSYFLVLHFPPTLLLYLLNIYSVFFWSAVYRSIIFSCSKRDSKSIFALKKVLKSEAFLIL
mmetsp:Transcript_34625/g.35973  ORF Transcript_34625/g.35973 Transcript_34625/m.35973 type:complete len:90 (-) Transcript_34625:1686-1955(-)